MTETIEVSRKNVTYEIEYFHRKSPGDTILYLHGLGTSKEDFFPALEIPQLHSFNLLAFDFPGCGKTNYDQEVALNVDDLVSITREIISKLELSRFHIIGHSMGGLTALLLSHRDPGKIASFINIEGNLAPIDCRVFSKYVTEYPIERNEESFFADFEDVMGKNKNREFDIFLSRLKDQVNYYALRDYCQSIVKYCSGVDLLSYFVGLSCPKMFIYGEENNDLPYINKLLRQGIQASEIPGSNHFPFYSNPEKFFTSISKFYQLEPDK